jgi:hypothetical protein
MAWWNDWMLDWLNEWIHLVSGVPSSLTHWERLVLRGLWIGVRKINTELIIEIIPIRGGNCSENMILVVGLVWIAKLHHLKCVEKLPPVVVRLPHLSTKACCSITFSLWKKQTRNVSFLECSMLSFPFFQVTVGKNILNNLPKIVKILKNYFQQLHQFN